MQRCNLIIHEIYKKKFFVLLSFIVIEVILQVFLLVFLKDDNNKRKLHKQYNTIIAISPLLEIYFASQQPHFISYILNVRSINVISAYVYTFVLISLSRLQKNCYIMHVTLMCKETYKKMMWSMFICV